MAREDIISALKNALDRKEPLEDAKRSLITAGYSLSDVEEAAKEAAEVSAETPPEFLKKAPAPGEISAGKILEKAPSPRKEKVKKKGMSAWIIISIVVVSLLLAGLLYLYVIK